MILRRLHSSFRLPPTIQQLLAHPSSAQITVSGWIKSVRRQKNVAFAVLTDGSCTQGLQAVFVGGGDAVKGYVPAKRKCVRAHVFSRLANGTAVRLTGKLVPSPGARQDKELLVDLSKGSGSGQVDGVHILGTCDPEVGP
jgi:asparaginyl-tRNA synthetase